MQTKVANEINKINKQHTGVDLSIFDGANIKIPSEKKISKSASSGNVISVGEIKKGGETYSLDIGSCVENETMRVLYSDNEKKLKIAPGFKLQVNARRIIEASKEEDKSDKKFDILSIPGGSRAYAKRKQPDNLRVRFAPPGATVEHTPTSVEPKSNIKSTPRKDKKEGSKDKSAKKKSKKNN